MWHPTLPFTSRSRPPAWQLAVLGAAFVFGSACFIDASGDDDDGGPPLEGDCAIEVATDGATAPASVNLGDGACSGEVPAGTDDQLLLRWRDPAAAEWAVSLFYENVSLGVRVQARRATVTLERIADGARWVSEVPCSGDLDRNVLDEVTSEGTRYRLEGEVFCSEVALLREDLDDGTQISVSSLSFVGQALAPAPDE